MTDPSTGWLDPQKYQGALGIVVFLAFAWLLSERRALFPWRVVVTALGLQVLLAVLIIRTELGIAFFASIDFAFRELIDYSREGASMVFGPLADLPLMEKSFGAGKGLVVAIPIASSIILVSALSSLLYHFGVLQFIVRVLAVGMKRIMGVSGSESLAAAANIFMGQTEAPLVIRPYLVGMTRSELMALMVGGMATIAGGVLAAYVSIGISAAHLLTASVMSAPAALMMAKIMIPEQEASPTAAGANAKIPMESQNALDALCTGTTDGLKLALNVLAMLIAFVAIVALANGVLSGLLKWFGVGLDRPIQWLLGHLNSPLSFLMGVQPADCNAVGAILGERVVLNEFVAYISLSAAQANLHPHSVMIATFALCGFANFASIAIQIGGIGALAPERRAHLVELGFKSMLGGILACYCTACIASIIAPG